MPRSDSQVAAILADLNDAQREAVTHRDGPLLVIAGPGSGKTRVITRRAAYLVHTGVSPHNVLAITFTNKAADEMRQRIAALGVARGMWIHTFHALGARLLREFGPLAGVDPGFTIYDETDALRVIKEAFELADVSEGLLRPEQARERISTAKSRLLTPEEVSSAAQHHEQVALAQVYAAYEALLRQRNAVDFDDLLLRVATVLRDHPDVTERLNVRFRYVLIDEYQDTNHAQYLMAHFLTRHHRNICATGDPDQSIYGWRGADIRNILEFERDYPDAKIVRLEQNYRSTNSILRVASQLIRANRRRRHKELWSDLGVGEPVRVWRFAEGHEEAERIAEQIAALHAAGRPYSDMAILYRINAVSRGLEESLRHRGIPYKIVRGVEFYNRKEIRDVLAYLRILVNPADDVALLRVINTPPRGIGKTTLERVQAFHERLPAESGRGGTRPALLDVLRAAERVPGLSSAVIQRLTGFVGLLDRLRGVLELPVSQAVSAVLTETGLEKSLAEERDSGGEDRLANVQELVSAARRYEDEAEEPSVRDFLNRVSLASDQDQVDERAGVVLLMTLHAAKGLEFPIVFLVGLEQGLLPHEWALQSRDIEEERRLCFVGLTRAREHLYLSYAAERTIRGQPTPRSPSQFLFELGEEGLVFDEGGTDETAGDPPAANFVPLVDDLPPEEAARLVPRRRLRGSAVPDDVEDDSPPRSKDRTRRPRGTIPQQGSASPYADWKAGMLVEHDHYGVGQLLSIRPGGGQTRAVVRFAGYGEKTLILEFAPLRPLERRPR